MYWTGDIVQLWKGPEIKGDMVTLENLDGITSKGMLHLNNSTNSFWVVEECGRSPPAKSKI